jgi:hypothetical protein
MIDDVSDIAALYDSDPEREHARLERHQLEHDTTWRYLNRFCRLKVLSWKSAPQRADTPSN